MRARWLGERNGGRERQQSSKQMNGRSIARLLAIHRPLFRALVDEWVRLE